MLQIRPISDLRNKFKEIEQSVQQGQPVYLTKNGYGTMVVMSMEQYAALTDDIEAKLSEADRMAKTDATRYTEQEIFARVREKMDCIEPIRDSE